MPISRDEKFHRMNKVREAVEKQPRSFTELMSIVYSSKPPIAANRTLQYDLEGLRILGLIKLDGGRYHSTEQKIIYNNESEYKTALKHSKQLLFTTDNVEQKFDLMVPHIVADCLLDGSHDLLIEHLRTGYYEDIYRLVHEYQIALAEKSEMVKSQKKEVWDGTWREIILNPELKNRLSDLQGEIASKIYSLMARVENGVPLAGYCDACPTGYIKIL